jgi:FixJ family two-component response regulator
MLSAYADLTPIMAAINHGAIDRFYTKPWKGAVLRETSAKASAWALARGMQPSQSQSSDEVVKQSA